MILAAALLVASAVACVAPWAVRNAVVFGEPVFTTTHGGYTLALANNPAYYEEVLHGPPGAVWGGHRQWLWWDAVNRAGRGLPEPEADRRLRHEAETFIASRPREFARAALARLGRFWGVAPAAGVYATPLRVACAVWTAPLWVALGLGLSRRGTWRWPRAAAAAWLVALTLVHAVYWSDMRMRATVVPAVALVAASAVLPGHGGSGDRCRREG